MMKRILFLFATLAFTSAALATVETYKFDPAHSSINFTVRHIFSNVPGSFAKVEGVVAVDRDDLTKSTVETTIDIASIATNNEKRDAHLRSDAFFDAEKFSTATFKSTAWTKTGDATYDVTGDLTIKGVTKSVVLHVTSLGFGPGMNGAQISGWSASTTLKRSDFGVNGPAILGTGLGNDVAITINVEADLQKPSTADNSPRQRQFAGGFAPVGWGTKMFGPGNNFCFHGPARP